MPNAVEPGAYEQHREGMQRGATQVDPRGGARTGGNAVRDVPPSPAEPRAGADDGAGGMTAAASDASGASVSPAYRGDGARGISSPMRAFTKVARVLLTLVVSLGVLAAPLACVPAESGQRSSRDGPRDEVPNPRPRPRRARPADGAAAQPRLTRAPTASTRSAARCCSTTT